MLDFIILTHRFSISTLSLSLIFVLSNIRMPKTASTFREDTKCRLYWGCFHVEASLGIYAQDWCLSQQSYLIPFPWISMKTMLHLIHATKPSRRPFSRKLLSMSALLYITLPYNQSKGISRPTRGSEDKISVTLYLPSAPWKYIAKCAI